MRHRGHDPGRSSARLQVARTTAGFVMTRIAGYPRNVEMAVTTAPFARSAPRKWPQAISPQVAIVLPFENHSGSPALRSSFRSRSNYFDLADTLPVTFPQSVGIQYP